MFGSAILDTVIGMIFVFFLVSNISSNVFTYLSRWKQWRGTLLQKGMLYMLGEDILNKVMAHPLIRDRSLTLERNSPGTESYLKPDKLPEYIPPDVFSKALVDVLMTEAESHLVEQVAALLLKEVSVERGQETLQKDLANLTNQTEQEAIETIDKWIDKINLKFQVISQEQRAEIHAYIHDIFTYKEDINAYLELGLEQIESDLPQLTREFIRQNIQLLKRQLRITGTVETVEDKLDVLYKKIANWFDTATSSLTPIFRRWSQYTIILVSIGITLFFNINSLAIAETLWYNQTIRDAVVESASVRVAQIEAEGTDPATDERTAEQIFNEDLDALDIPVGWTQAEIENLFGPTPDFLSEFLAYSGEGQNRKLYGLFEILLGWTITVAAASLGAPFWYNVLQQLVNFRNNRRVDNA